MTMNAKPRHARFFPVLFGLIGVLFLGILLFVYRKANQADPVMLDEQGRVQAQQ